MRRQRPAALQRLLRALCVARLDLQSGEALGDGDALGREREGLARQRQRIGGIAVAFGGAAALDQQQRFQRAALVGGDDLAPLAGLERLLCRLPLADLGLHVEQRMHHPRRLRLQLEGALGIGQRLGLIALAQRLADQAAQAEEGGVLVLQHGGEGAVGAVAVAGELGGLRRQQSVIGGSARSCSALRACFCASAPSPAATAARPCVSSR